ncbi:MAG: hypothetical protein MUC92_00955 [Fimbriimonadaceae bacterium]|jgi:hypothetical protein|nr:hypothetical protein [Fimbriimonadaceae bacterium]
MAVTSPSRDQPQDRSLKKYQAWFYAATAYNVVWGLFAIFFPSLPFTAVGLEAPNYPALFQCIGMMVLVYALGYYYIAKDPERYGAFVWIGLLGKTFGPIGFVYAYFTGQLPLAFGITIIFNDLIWWPAFWGFALKYARKPLL